jgi:hypothetical protein
MFLEYRQSVVIVGITALLASMIILGCGENTAPFIDDLMIPDEVKAGDSVQLEVVAHDLDGNTLTYTWEVDRGQLSSTTGRTVTWTAPNGVKSVTVTVLVSDGVNSPIVESRTITIVQVRLIVKFNVPDSSIVGEDDILTLTFGNVPKTVKVAGIEYPPAKEIQVPVNTLKLTEGTLTLVAVEWTNQDGSMDGITFHFYLNFGTWALKGLGDGTFQIDKEGKIASLSMSFRFPGCGVTRVVKFSNLSLPIHKTAGVDASVRSQGFINSWQATITGEKVGEQITGTYEALYIVSAPDGRNCSELVSGSWSASTVTATETPAR